MPVSLRSQASRRKTFLSVQSPESHSASGQAVLQQTVADHSEILSGLRRLERCWAKPDSKALMAGVCGFWLCRWQEAKTGMGWGAMQVHHLGMSTQKAPLV